MGQGTPPHDPWQERLILFAWPIARLLFAHLTFRPLLFWGQDVMFWTLSLEEVPSTGWPTQLFVPVAVALHVLQVALQHRLKHSFLTSYCKHLATEPWPDLRAWFCGNREMAGRAPLETCELQ